MNNQGILSRRIPTLLGLVILIGGLVAGIFLVNRKQGLETKAGPTAVPRDVIATNMAANSFTVSWVTDTPVTGFVKYSEDPAKIVNPAGDLRDQTSGSSQSYLNHYVNISNLKADTTYYVLIGSGPKTYDDGGKPFQFRTGPQVIPPAEDVVSGKVIDNNGNGVSGAIIYTDIDGGKTLSTLSTMDGSFRLNLGMVRDAGGRVFDYKMTSPLLRITVNGGASGKATAVTSLDKSKPVPDITMGTNQNFVENVITANQTSVETKSEGFKQLASAQSSSTSLQTSDSTSSVKILNPAIDGEMIATASPEIMGKATPGTDLLITVKSLVEQSQAVKADALGNWKWTPPKALEAGLHTVSVTFKNELNVMQTISRNFTVLAARDAYGLPSFTATPSAFPSASISATPSPTKIIDSVMPPATKDLTDAGVEDYLWLFGISGVGLIVIGRLLKSYFKSY